MKKLQVLQRHLEKSIHLRMCVIDDLENEA